MDTGENFFEKFALFLLVDVNQQAPHLEGRGLKNQEQVCSENTCGPAYRVLFSKYTKSLPHETMNDIE